ncbi:hypothetical protein [Allobranchiibius sp. CTAmp26]|uniref:hypothetical protein n=1 Tax=Allobranchiibius sp. CTAmp26 TaxID=2815214 RepID=UPI001AA1B008|nr:hypothetical protein [Allobranchiibius sp. CTAmp26]MBO1753558.1 hypothetical protein [Allobranchiibius sp. CTAmp26]
MRCLEETGRHELARAAGCLVPQPHDEIRVRLDLRALEERYGFPYMVIHRSDLHGMFLRACERAGVELVHSQKVVG